MSVLSQLILFVGIAVCFAWMIQSKPPKHGAWDLQPFGMMSLITELMSMIIIALVYFLFVRWLYWLWLYLDVYPGN